MNKFALVTVAAIPGQGSGTSAFRKAEVWKAEEKPQVFLVYDKMPKATHVTFERKDFPTFEEWDKAYQALKREKNAKKIRELAGFVTGSHEARQSRAEKIFNTPSSPLYDPTYDA